LDGVLDPPAELGVLGVRPVDQLTLGHLEVAEDDGEKIVEVVRDPVSWPIASILSAWRSDSSATTRWSTSRYRRCVRRKTAYRVKNKSRVAGNAEQDVRRDAADPLVANRGGCNSGAEIKRRIAKAAGPQSGA
jgi:hypothetical protein